MCWNWRYVVSGYMEVCFLTSEAEEINNEWSRKLRNIFFPHLLAPDKQHAQHERVIHMPHNSHLHTRKDQKKLFRAVIAHRFRLCFKFQKNGKEEKRDQICRRIGWYLLHNEHKMILWQQRWIGKVATANQSIKSHIARKQPNDNNEQRWWWQPTLWGRFHPNVFVSIPHLESYMKAVIAATFTVDRSFENYI